MNSVVYITRIDGISWKLYDSPDGNVLESGTCSIVNSNV